MNDRSLLDVFFDHLEQGDVASAVECLAPNGQIWHCYDRIAHNRDSAARDLAAFVANCPTRRFTEVRSQPTDNGFVRQHVMTIGPADGPGRSFEICAVAIVEDGRIARIDEYLDRASSIETAA